MQREKDGNADVERRSQRRSDVDIIAAPARVAHSETMTRRMFRSAFAMRGFQVGLGILAVLVVAEGLIAPIELLSTVGNVLSYARVMAIGTASVMMAVPM